MPQLIQRAPVGLLALTDSKAGGAAPNSLLDEVRPTIDVAPYYELRSRLTRQSPAVTAATLLAGLGTFVDASTTLLNPLPDEIWHVRSLSFFGSTLGAGGRMQLSLGVRDPRFTATQGFMLLGTSPVFNGATDAPGFGVAVDLYLSAGWPVGLFVNACANGVDLRVQATFDLYKPV